MRLSKKVFGEQIKAASNTEAKAELAVKFLTTSAAASNRFEKYALLEKAQDLAVEANDPQLYFRTLDAMDETFLIDKIKLWNDQLGKLMDGQVDEATLRKLAECDCVAAEHPEKRSDAGDSWYELLENLKGPAAKIAKDRVVLHYQAALPGLKGLAKLQVQKRVQECIEKTARFFCNS